MKLPDSELEVMLVLWQNSPLKTPEIMKALKHTGWSISTLQALLQRLEDKGAVSKTMEGRTKLYSPLVTQKEYSHDLSNDMLKRFYRGSISSFLAHFAEAEGMTQKDLEEIQAIIDRKGK